MLYPENIEIKLGFDKIKHLISEYCLSNLGKSYIPKIKFSSNHGLIKKMLAQTFEFCGILLTETDFPGQYYIDTSAYLEKAKLSGAILFEEEFHEILLSLGTIQQIFSFFNEQPEEKYPQLKSLMQSAVSEERPKGWTGLIREISTIIDENGQVRDSASKELSEIRRKLAAEQSNIKRTLERIYRTAKNSGWIGEDMSIAVRNGRLVIPVLAEHKRKLSGFVHDETSSGNIAFVEPGEVLEANNEIRDLEIKERREILKILEKLTDLIRPEIPDLEKSYIFLGLIDFIRAKAKFSNTIDAVFPILTDEPEVEWQNAKHPILFLAHKKIKKSIVPLNVKLNQNNRILVVSGPNAGGKSVLLKTIGLIQYMTQSGLLPPVSSDSKVGIFRSIFIDIGDEQSIENDLSTYSSHLRNMREFLQHADGKSIFLIDEFGTGTEPSLGGALAEAILENLNQKGALGVVNTHYTNLKSFADKTEGLINGAMLFDAEELSPMFQLEMGRPGHSFAFEVAQKMGLPHQIIRNAKRKVDKNQVNFDKLLKELDIEKKTFREQNASLRAEIEELKRRSEQYASLKDFIETDKKRILDQAKAEAGQIVKDANKTIENTIRQIKESNAEKEATRLAREQVKVFEEKKLKTENPIRRPVQTKVISGVIEVGDYVRIKGRETIGQVMNINGKDAEIILGQLKSNIKLSRLEKVSRKEFKDSEKKSVTSVKGVDLNQKMTDFSFNLDIRGKRGDEALKAVDDLIDDALLLGYPELRIVHGKGDGILRTLIRNHIKQYKQISKVKDEHPDRGGQGVTIIEMK